MKLKYKISIFNIITRLLLIVILWFALPFTVETIIYKNTNKGLLEKRDRFIKNLNKDEIQDFLISKDTSEDYGSFSTLHNEFIQLKQVPKTTKKNKDVFLNEMRIIENETSEYRVLQHHFDYNKAKYKLEIGSSIKEINDLKESLHFFIIITFLILSFLTFIVDNFYVGFLLKPLKEIVETKIKLINNPEKFNPIPVTTSSTEFKDLDIALNKMMLRITELFLKEKEFIGNVSHELMTPISILKNRFENLIQNQSLNNNAVDKISNSLNTLDAMKKVINNLLLISRIDNKLYQTNELINFNEILQYIIENQEDRIKDKQLIITNNLKYKFEFYGNKSLIQVLFSNILSNAIKYNKKSGSISIFDEFEQDKYTIKIVDAGIGMTTEQVSRIFNRFTRINFDQEGQGIGLAIVDSIAHLHDIQIVVNSQINIGTTFILVFPKNFKVNKILNV